MRPMFVSIVLAISMVCVLGCKDAEQLEFLCETPQAITNCDVNASALCQAVKGHHHPFLCDVPLDDVRCVEISTTKCDGESETVMCCNVQ